MFTNSMRKHMAQSFPHGSVLSLTVVGLDGRPLAGNGGVADRLKGTALAELTCADFEKRENVFRVVGKYLDKSDVKAAVPVDQLDPMTIMRVEVLNLCTGMCAMYYPKRSFPSGKVELKLAGVNMLVPNVVNEDGLLEPKTVDEWVHDPRSVVYGYLEPDRYSDDEDSECRPGSPTYQTCRESHPSTGSVRVLTEEKTYQSA